MRRYRNAKMRQWGLLYNPILGSIIDGGCVMGYLLFYYPAAKLICALVGHKPRRRWDDGWELECRICGQAEQVSVKFLIEDLRDVSVHHDGGTG